MIDAKIRFVGANGRSVTLTNSANDLMRMPGASGWGMVPVANSWFEGAGDGARLQGTRRLMRELTIPVGVFGLDRQDVENKLRQVTNTIREPFKIFMDYSDGRSYYIGAVYDSGASGQYGSNPGRRADLPIVLKCPDPYWTSVQAQSFKVAPATGAPFLPVLSALHITSSVAQGKVEVTNIGDVASRPTWTITGPGNNLSLSVAGQGLSLVKLLGSSDVVTIKHDGIGWTVTDQAGANLYANLGPAPYFPEFPPGTSIVDVSMTDATSATAIQAIYPERREVLY